MAMYGNVAYWNERYRATEENGPYEWYRQSYATLKRLLSPSFLSGSLPQTRTATDRCNSFAFRARSVQQRLNPSPAVSVQHEQVKIDKLTCRVLILGCGNSTFGEDMVDDGWEGGITNIDFSDVVIDQMRQKYRKRLSRKNANSDATPYDQMKFIKADVTEQLPFPDQSFDLIICKATMDAVLCSTSSVHGVAMMIRECHRVLSNDVGVLFLVTHGNPDARVVFLEYRNDVSYYWKEVSTHRVKRVGQSKSDFVYICRKQPRAVSMQTETKGLSTEATVAEASHKGSTGRRRNT